MPLDQYVSQRLKLLVSRYSKGKWTVFARSLGINDSTMKSWLDGVSLPSGAHLQKIKAALPEVSLDWLLAGEEPEEKENSAIMREPPKGFGLIRLPDDRPLSDKEKDKLEGFLAGMRSVLRQEDETEGLAGQKTA